MLAGERSTAWAPYVARRDDSLAALGAAASRTTWWSRVFDELAMPLGPRTVEELSRLPLLSKDDVREHAHEMLDPSVPESARKWVTTGGSTGAPLGLWISKDASAIDWAFVVDAWNRVGFNLDEKRVVLRGRRLGSAGRRELVEYEPMRRELYVSTFDLDEEHLPAIRRAVTRFGARYLHGYPSAMQALGRSYAHSGDVSPRWEALLAVSEALDPSQRSDLERLLGARVFSFYGMTEKAAFAAECEHSNELHVDERYGIVELVDAEGRVVDSPGVVGEVVATGLISSAMPLLRYRTGDRAAWAEGDCPCGRPMRRLLSVEGRWNGSDALVGIGGAIIPMTALNVHSPVFDRVQRFRFLQERPGAAALLVLPGAGFGQADEAAILGELGGKLEGQVSLTLERVDELPLTVRGKLLFVDQRIEG
jgi:phenylacetate-CoA ligase